MTMPAIVTLLNWILRVIVAFSKTGIIIHRFFREIELSSWRVFQWNFKQMMCLHSLYLLSLDATREDQWTPIGAQQWRSNNPGSCQLHNQSSEQGHSAAGPALLLRLQKLIRWAQPYHTGTQYSNFTFLKIINFVWEYEICILLVWKFI